MNNFRGKKKRLSNGSIKWQIQLGVARQIYSDAYGKKNLNFTYKTMDSVFSGVESWGFHYISSKLSSSEKMN